MPHSSEFRPTIELETSIGELKLCGDAIGNFFEGASEFAGNFLMEHMPVTVVVGTFFPLMLPVMLLHDFSTVDDDDVNKPQTRLDELNNITYGTAPSNVMPEDFSQVSFATVMGKFSGAYVPPGVAQIWGDIRNKIVEATQNFERDLAALEGRGGKDSWKGTTHDAALGNIKSSLTEPAAAGGGAGVMEILVDAWATTLSSIHTYIQGNWANYQNDLKAHPEFQDEVTRDYNSFAQKVMRDIYVPNVVEIAKRNPAFTGGGPPAVGGTPGAGPGGGPGSVGGPGPFGGGPGSIGGPKIPDLGGPTAPQIPSTGPTDSSTVPSSGDSGATDPGQFASGAGQNPFGQAADAANQAAQGLQGMPNTGQQLPPEGVLGLGPTGLSGAGAGGAGKGGGLSGRTGGGAGTTPPRGLASGRTVSTPAAAATKLPTATRAATAGLGAMGAPGTGAPAAGQRGGDNTAYTASKALRRKKNGQKVAGDAEAVVPVIGAPEKRPMTEANQRDQADQPDQPDRGGGGVRAAPWATRGAEHATATV